MRNLTIVAPKKWILAFVFFLSLLSSVQAQQKSMYVPDPEFRKFLKERYANCMKGDSILLGCNEVINATSLDISSKKLLI